METFYYKHKGTNNDTWGVGEVQAKDIAHAQQQLDSIYGIQRNEKGEQTNGDVIIVVFCTASEYRRIKGSADISDEAVHKVEPMGDE